MSNKGVGQLCSSRKNSNPPIFSEKTRNENENNLAFLQNSINNVNLGIKGHHQMQSLGNYNASTYEQKTFSLQNQREGDSRISSAAKKIPL